MIREMMHGTLSFKEKMLSILEDRNITFINSPDWNFIENNRLFCSDFQVHQNPGFHYKVKTRNRTEEGDVIADDYQDVMHKLNLNEHQFKDDEFIIIEPNYRLSRYYHEKDYTATISEYKRLYKLIKSLRNVIDKEDFFKTIEQKDTMVLFIADDLVAVIDTNWMELIDGKEEDIKKLYLGNLEFYFDKIGKSLGECYNLSAINFKGYTKNDYAHYIIHTKPEYAQEFLKNTLRNELNMYLNELKISIDKIEHKKIYYKTFYAAFLSTDYLIAERREITPFIARLNVRDDYYINLQYDLFVGVKTDDIAIESLKAAFYDYMKIRVHSKFKLVFSDIDKHTLYIENEHQKYIFFPIIGKASQTDPLVPI